MAGERARVEEALTGRGRAPGRAGGTIADAIGKAGRSSARDRAQRAQLRETEAEIAALRDQLAVLAPAGIHDDRKAAILALRRLYKGFIGCVLGPML